MNAMLPRIFIGSSVEDLDIAHAIQENLDYYASITVWDQGIFPLSQITITSLINSLDKFDYAIFVFGLNNEKNINEVLGTQANVFFELGLFISKIGMENVFYVIPRGFNKVYFPSDLQGITSGTYKIPNENISLKSSLAPFCSQVREKINMKSPKKKSDSSPVNIFKGTCKDIYTFVYTISV